MSCERQPPPVADAWLRASRPAVTARVRQDPCNSLSWLVELWHPFESWHRVFQLASREDAERHLDPYLGNGSTRDPQGDELFPRE